MLEPGSQRKARQELAESLRELRRASGLSGERLATRCAMSQSKISRIESGKIVPTVVDVERILNALQVSPAVVAELLNAARAANVDYASWRSVARNGMWRKQAEYKALAESSSIVRQFLPAAVSGLIQVSEYARSTLTPTVEGRPARDIERAVRVRMESQAALENENRQFIFLFTEQAVRWRIADSVVQIEQLGHLITVADRPNVDLAVLPAGTEVNVPPLNVFVIYDDRLVLAELFSGEVALRDPRDVAYHLNVFDYFLERALTGDRATTFLHGIMREQD
jgi:transcriptional regulator with XRE-family HTH domain